MSKLDLCLERLCWPEFAEQVRTDYLTIPEVAAHIASSAGLTLRPNTDTVLGGRLRLAWTSPAHPIAMIPFQDPKPPSLQHTRPRRRIAARACGVV